MKMLTTFIFVDMGGGHGRDVVENRHFMKGYLCRWGPS